MTGILEKRGPYQALNELLTQWSKRSDKPIVLLVDELDTLNGTVLSSFFRNHILRLGALVDYGEASSILVFHALLQKMVDVDTRVSRDFVIGKNRVVFQLHRSAPVPQDDRIKSQVRSSQSRRVTLWGF